MSLIMADDRPGVTAAVNHLRMIGYSNIRIIHHPVDISADMNGETYWIEVKYSESKDGKMFGAATITEWECALENPNNFFFLIAHKPGGEDNDSEWKFVFISPAVFEPFSTVPPFKINFNYDVNNPNHIPNRRSALPATEENLKSLIQIFKSMKIEEE